MSTYFAEITTSEDTYPVPFGRGGLEWAIAAGYEAPIQGWEMDAGTAASIMADLEGSTGRDREISLQFGDRDDPVTVERVIVIGLAASRNRQRRVLLMTDVRNYFKDRWDVADGNVRHRVGDSRLVGDTIYTGEVVAPTIEYGEWSLDPATVTAYDWAAFKDRVVAYLSAGDGERGQPAVDFVTDDFSIDVAAQVIQETVTDAPATVGLGRAVEAIPGAGIYVSKEGVVHVMDRTLGAEIDYFAGITWPELMNHGSLILVDNTSIRPFPGDTSWRVLVDKELEVRCTYNNTGHESPAGSAWSLSAGNNPYMSPVLQVTDLSLSVAGITHPLGQGSWVEQALAFVAWGPGPTYGSIVLPQLTDEIVAKHWFGSSLQRYTVGGNISTYDPVWSARIDEVMRTFRTYFRINPQFWARVRHAWAVRAAIWDPTTGTRATSPVYSNFNKMELDRFAAATIMQLSQDVMKSYDESMGNEGKLASSQPSKFLLEIVDMELGIVRIVRDVSRFPGFAWLSPSPVRTKATLTGGAGLNEAVLQQLVSDQDVTVDDVTTPGWKLATVLSCAPAAPNGIGRLYEVPVSFDDAVATAGLTGTLVPPTTGAAPDREMRTRLADARFAWRDNDLIANEVLANFGVGDMDPDNPLVPINLENELVPLAKAIAAADLMNKLDHYQGTAVVPMNGDLVPIGSLTKVIHKVTKNRAVSILVCEGAVAQFNPIEFLSGTARNFILKQIQAVR